MFYLALACRSLIGMVFMVSALSKLRGRAAFGTFVSWLASLPVMPARWSRAVAVVIAVAEVLVVTLLALPWTATAGLAFAAATLAAFAAGAFVVTRHEPNVPCQCFGPSSVPLSGRHVARDVVLCAIAALGAAGAAGQMAARLPAITLSVGCGLAVSLLVIFLDDVVALIPRNPASRKASS